MAKHTRRLTGLIMVLFLVIAGCSTGGSSGGGDDEPLETQDIAGVWLGYIGSTFALGIITEEGDALFIGQDTSDQFNQFISPDGDPLGVTPPTVFSGILDLCIWNTSGPDAYGCSPFPGDLLGAAATRRILGVPPFGAAYRNTYADSADLFLFVYNTTYTETPDVHNISGQWEIRRAFTADNTLVLTITPVDGSTRTATITGTDDHLNNFDGTISIHYNADNTANNVYDVRLRLNDTELLEGLATYVLQMNTQSIEIPVKTLAIGAANADRTRSLSGLAVKSED